MSFIRKLFSKKNTDNSNINSVEVVTTSDPTKFPESMKLLNPEESSLINEWLSLGPSFLASYGDGSKVDELQNYDAAFEAWLSSDRSKPDRDEVIAAVGAFLGSRLVSDYGMQWVRVTDEYGEEFGVRHESVTPNIRW